MKKLFVIIFVFSICGCSRYDHFTLIQNQEVVIGSGLGKRGSKFVSLSIRDKVYEGKYVYVDDKQNKNRHQQESRIENIYFLDSANGIIRATSEDGGSIYCEFKGLGSFGEGICMNSKGEKYKLLIHS